MNNSSVDAWDGQQATCVQKLGAGGGEGLLKIEEKSESFWSASIKNVEETSDAVDVSCRS